MNDEDAVIATALDYFEGWYDADPVRVDRALHPQLVKRSVHQVRDNSGSLTKGRMLALVRASGGAADKTADPIDVVVVDIHHDIATAVVRSVQYREYLHLVRTDSGWQIVNAFWEFTDAGPDGLPGGG